MSDPTPPKLNSQALAPVFALGVLTVTAITPFTR